MKSIVPKTLWHTLVLDVVTAIQAGRRIYFGALPMRLLSELFGVQDAAVEPDKRAQRTPSPTRIGMVTRYLLEQRDEYIFKSVTLSLDGNLDNVGFVPALPDRNYGPGQLSIGPDVYFVLNDGQHRIAGIIAALAHNQKTALALGYEHLPAVLLFDQGLQRAQQVFADLNRHAAKPSASLNLAYDRRDRATEWTRRIIAGVPLFRSRVELERNTLGKTSEKLFTLSNLHQANCRLAGDLKTNEEDRVAGGAAFWNAASSAIPDWHRVLAGQLAPADLRRTGLHGHRLMLLALAEAGRLLLAGRASPDLPKRLAPLGTIEWSISILIPPSTMTAIRLFLARPWRAAIT